MSPAHPSVRVIRFGIFELDRTAGELRKNGIKIRLQEQPFQVLAFLLERPGAVVTRDELREKLWPADTFVDFDHSLNTAINKVREALGDSATSPRYVGTLARRGYRFLGTIDAGQGPDSTQSSASVIVHPDLDVPIPRRGTTRGLFALIQIMYLVFYSTALFHWSQIENIAAPFLPGRGPFAIAVVVLITGLAGIPLRCYLLSATAFDFGGLGKNFQRMFPAVLMLDQIWALAPFLLAPQIGFAPAFAATALLLYVPFSERTLLRMAYRKGPSDH